ncbi:Acyl-CoA synthetase short-chain member 3, mitochondrial [Cladochytrium tenue]|nr:Acyl-CoA synthetase short-chain member 3, mitochondrial [Cladochytrium tenue]
MDVRVVNDLGRERFQRFGATGAGFTKTYLGKFGTGDMGGWIDTSDAAMMDERGYVTILASIDNIILVAAHGLGTDLIKQEEGDRGQVPFALVAAREGPGATSSANDQAARDLMCDINEHVHKDLGPIAQLGSLVVKSKLPKPFSGKTPRRSVQAIVENAAENKPDGEVLVPPTLEDAGVKPVVKEAVFTRFVAPAAV